MVWSLASCLLSGNQATRWSPRSMLTKIEVLQIPPLELCYTPFHYNLQRWRENFQTDFVFDFPTLAKRFFP